MPKRIPLITPFVTVCKEGMTIDGREVKAEWLKEAAETYNRELRDAPIDADHMLSWYGRFGTVDALRANTNSNGETILEAKLEPNMRMLEQNGKGQRLHTSVHITKDNSPVSGKWYMVGLALTDNPAVNTTTELKFCSEDANEHILRNSEFDSLVFLDNKEEFSSEELSTFKKLMSKLGIKFPTNNNQSLTNNKNEDQAMSKESLDAILAAQNKTNEALTSLVDAIGNKFKKDGDSKNNADDGKTDDSENNADDGKTDDSKNNADAGKTNDSKNNADNGKTDSAQLATLQASVDGTNKAVAALTSTIREALDLPGEKNTEFGTNTGDGAADILY